MDVDSEQGIGDKRRACVSQPRRGDGIKWAHMIVGLLVDMCPRYSIAILKRQIEYMTSL